MCKPGDLYRQTDRQMKLFTRQSVAVQREGGIPVGKKILYQGP